MIKNEPVARNIPNVLAVACELLEHVWNTWQTFDESQDSTENDNPSQPEIRNATTSTFTTNESAISKALIHQLNNF